MVFKQIFFAPELGPDVWLDAYLADPLPRFQRRAILVIPGGAYAFVCADREGEPIAHAFLARGYNAFVLHYSVNRSKAFPSQLQEASLALAHIRENADAYGIDPQRLFTVGFSAGGHLAGALGTMWHRPEAWQKTGLAFGSNRPDGMMLIYPVVSGAAPFSHRGSCENLLCSDAPTREQLQDMSLELAVSERSAPLFLVHSSNDATVDVRNALVLAEAYRAHGLQFEMHIYPDAQHGFALCNDITSGGNAKMSNKRIERWVDDAVSWAESLPQQ